MEKRGKSSRLIIIIFFIPFLIWILLQFFAPIALPNGSVEDLSGNVGVTDNQMEINEMPAPWNAIYASGDSLCHQKAERSLFINGNQMPYCSRCTAIWLGFAIGIGFMIFYKIELDWRFIILIFFGLIPIGIDGGGQLLGFWESNNFSRFITGILIGIICGITIAIIIDEIKDMITPKKNEIKIKE